MSLGVEDRLALTDLVHRYAARVDDLDEAGVAALFTEDGVLISPDPPRRLEPVVEHAGRAAVERAMAPLHTLDATLHSIVGVVLDAGEHPDTATGRIACLAHHVSRRDDVPRDIVWAVTYRDTYTRTADGWRFARRAASATWVEVRPLKVAALRPDSPAAGDAG